MWNEQLNEYRLSGDSPLGNNQPLYKTHQKIDISYQCFFMFSLFAQALQSINTLLEKADRVYKTLVAFRPSLEILLLRVYDHGSDKAPTGDPLVDGVIGKSLGC